MGGFSRRKREEGGFGNYKRFFYSKISEKLQSQVFM